MRWIYILIDLFCVGPIQRYHVAFGARCAYCMIKTHVLKRDIMQSPANNITIMTYNILVGGKDGRMPAIEAVIRECEPDIVGVQEANDIAACHALADRMGMECI